MSGFFSTVAGQFGKSFVLGTLLPVFVFTVLFIYFVDPLLPEGIPVIDPLAAFDAPWRVILILFGTIVASGLLYNLNIPLIRFYEGYPWKSTWLGKWRTRHYERVFGDVHARWRGLRTLSYALSRDGKTSAEVRKEYIEMGEEVSFSLPRRKSSVLPTKLGNVIRSFEGYSYKQYRIDSITLWPRLISKIDKEYATAISDAKAFFDFMLNSSALCITLALSILVVGLLFPFPFAGRRLLVPWVMEILFFSLLAWLFYQWSISRAKAWGNLVRGSFDLYRWELLDQLGYKYVPETLTEERKLWDDITLQLLYGDAPRLRPAKYVPESTSVSGDPYFVDIRLARGVSEWIDEKTVEIILTIKNDDARERAVKRVIVKDTLPEGCEYMWGSARMNNGNIPVTGINPYYFEIGDLTHGDEKMLTYRAIWGSANLDSVDGETEDAS